jgi:DNA-binding NarL/FixJ family response regulator
MFQSNAALRQSVPPARVLLVDDHPTFRAGVVLLLSSDPELEIVGEAADARSAIALATQLRPDVVILDLSLPDGHGVDLTRELLSKVPELKVMGLSAHEDPAFARAMLDAGAKGYVVKRSAGDDLIRAIKQTAAGQTYLDPGVAGSLVGNQSPQGTGQRSAVNLSEREAQVIRLVAGGHTAKEIAQDLGLSARTLETYRARAMSKLNLHTRAELIRYALRCGWLRQS